jgi:hypothetical protein
MVAFQSSILAIPAILALSSTAPGRHLAIYQKIIPIYRILFALAS